MLALGLSILGGLVMPQDSAAPSYANGEWRRFFISEKTLYGSLSTLWMGGFLSSTEGERSLLELMPQEVDYRLKLHVVDSHVANSEHVSYITFCKQAQPYAYRWYYYSLDLSANRTYVWLNLTHNDANGQNVSEGSTNVKNKTVEVRLKDNLLKVCFSGNDDPPTISESNLSLSLLPVKAAVTFASWLKRAGDIGEFYMCKIRAGNMALRLTYALSSPDMMIGGGGTGAALEFPTNFFRDLA